MAFKVGDLVKFKEDAPSFLHGICGTVIDVNSKPYPISVELSKESIPDRSPILHRGPDEDGRYTTNALYDELEYDLKNIRNKKLKEILK